MRPVLLDMNGFGSYREPTTVDFRDVDYFALVGPTGSGKSTVIDAMTFALYGSVPRWDDRRTVGLALAPTASRGTVRLVFDVAGQRHVVARELRRSARGTVNVKNARLERLRDPTALGDPGEDTEVIAADREVTPAVERLLGLPYEHFITCVVLPQGDFAEFLHAKPAHRQEILVRLLGLEIYQKIAQAANAEATAHRQRVEQLAEQLSDLADATPEAEAAAVARRDALAQLAAEVHDALPRLAAAQAARVEAEQALTTLRHEREVLAALTVPPGAAELAARRETAQRALREAAEQAERAERADTAAREALARAPDRTSLERASDAWRELAAIEAALPAARAELARRAEQVAAVTAQGSRARRCHDDAEAARQAAQRADLVAALRPHLAVGEPCPVCEQKVAALPPAAPAAELDAAEHAVATARQEVERLRQAWERATRAQQQAASALAVQEERARTLRAGLRDAPDPAAVAAGLAELTRLEERRDRADETLRAARAAHRRAERAAANVDQEVSAARRELERARDGLVPLGAPALSDDDLAGAWTALVGWATQAAAARAKDVTAAEEKVTAARAALAETEQGLATRLAACDVPVEGGRPLAAAAEAAVARALERAENELTRVRERRAQAARLAARRDEAAQQAEVAKMLGLLLRADAFPRWLVTTALDTLVAEASTTLTELSGGQYALEHDNGEFLVVDRADADSRRPVKTLSGGETFQASLSLALALSSQLAGMAAVGATRLDSIFLDEGFGTLDEATLEVVAATLESLAAHGERMVGLVTHVGALAERVPVRFVVHRDQRSSHVTRESA